MSDAPKLDLEERQRAQQVYEECCENPEDFAYNFVALQRELAQVQASWSATIEAAAQNDALLSRRIAELEAILPESLAAIEEIHGDHCSAWCGYRELRVKLHAAIDAARAKEGK